ncbi:MerR family transcriptional regulator [Breznakia pachnodae]|uniref:DNA-binding transcriptional MerR regulator n=1 Tax=Breznakia pachnodae TaxID=265178 RepID=A0ABU0E6I8_9FIRM|nr:MerR family transcriptional regulator [Breznakia pachnodae]MDQ0362105.1 DNA-binding transcriptional MerR regulator [Breznakia pachnodae]
MATYTVNEVSKMLKIPRDTLRYYDRIGLLQPKRRDNKYRSYSQEEIMDLKYISVLKYGGFALSEIQQILNNKQDDKNAATSIKCTIELLNKKEVETQKAIKVYQYILRLIELSVHTLEHEKKENPEVVNTLVSSIYDEINKEED